MFYCINGESFIGFEFYFHWRKTFDVTIWNEKVQRTHFPTIIPHFCTNYYSSKSRIFPCVRFLNLSWPTLRKDFVSNCKLSQIIMLFYSSSMLLIAQESQQKSIISRAFVVRQQKSSTNIHTCGAVCLYNTIISCPDPIHKRTRSADTNLKYWACFRFWKQPMKSKTAFFFLR